MQETKHKGIVIRHSDKRGYANHGWLEARHSFSFANYFDPSNMGFRSLRVINEDRVMPSKGFGTHPHRDMEIVTYPLAGVLEHRDSMGNGSQLRYGMVQRMSAGTGITHSEFNASEDEILHLLQIWLLPNADGIEPSWEEKHFSEDDKRGALKLIVSEDAREDSLKIHQDMSLYASILAEGESVEHTLENGRHAWIQLIRGSLGVDNETMEAGDGAAVSSIDELTIQHRGDEEAEFLLFDLA